MTRKAQHEAIREKLDQRCENRCKLTHVIMREILEDLGLTELYDDAIYLAHYHGGPKPPKFTPDQLIQLKIMFKQMEKHFDESTIVFKSHDYRYKSPGTSTRSSIRFDHRQAKSRSGTTRF